mmetsp:Transcript_107529/g.202096  ORF Transcript_107529/g.202096 Transcript_107529/m.202096 type:complete len:123 (-) Transcript_107529:14-382(-)
MYFVVEGLARYDHGVRWQPPGTEDAEAEPHRFQHIGMGESFGEEIIFGLAETYSYTVMTIMDSKFSFIDETQFKEHFKNLPHLHDQMYATVVQPHFSMQAAETDHISAANDYIFMHAEETEI